MSHLAPRTLTASVGESGVFSLSFWLDFALFLFVHALSPLSVSDRGCISALFDCWTTIQHAKDQHDDESHVPLFTAYRCPCFIRGGFVGRQLVAVFFFRSMRTDRSILVSALYYLAWGMTIHAPVCWSKLPEICRVSI